MRRLVIKIGGHALDRLDPSSPVLRDLAEDVASLDGTTATVIVHGGGPQISSLLSDVGIASEFVDGLRVTDDATMPYVAMALGYVNAQMTASLQRCGLRTVGISGADGGLVRAIALGAPWGRAAASIRVRDDVVTALMDGGWTPVVSSLGVDDEGGLVNCNADTVAGGLAGALDADLLVLLSDVDRVRSDPDDPATAMGAATAVRIRDLIATGAIRDGMRPKMIAALDALGAGARRVVLANGTRPHALAGALAGTATTTEVTR